jgi:heptosyltransferase-2
VALHIAIALKKFTVAIFGPTCDKEVELYGRGIKIISPIDCRPCYKKQCTRDINCMDLIKPEEVFTAVQKLLSKCKF